MQKVKRKPATESVKLPFSVKYLESALEWKRGAVVLSNLGMRSTVRFSSETLNKMIYGNIRGPLLSLSKKLGRIVNNLLEDGSNYMSVLREWSATIMHGLLVYDIDEMHAQKITVQRYLDLFDRYQSTFARAFVAEDLSSDDNYEEIEIMGDATYKNALIFYFWRELHIRNKSITTVLRHTHENTKALFDLATIFGMDKLVRSKGSKRFYAVCEDVFESVIGTFQEMEWEIQADPRSPEFLFFSANNGFATRLVRMVFQNSDARQEYKIAPKTFITGLQGTFSTGADKMYIKEEFNNDMMMIVFKTPVAILNIMSQIFGCRVKDLTKVLNCTYMSEDPKAGSKHFSSIVYESIVTKLEKLGITQQTFQAIKNRGMVPPLFHDRMNKLFAASIKKGYWIGISVPKSSKGAKLLSVRCTLYHNDPTKSLPRAAVDGYLKENETDAFNTLFTKIESIIAKLPNIDVSVEKPIFNTVIEKATEESATSTEHRSNSRSMPVNWREKAGDSSNYMVTRNNVLSSNIAGNPENQIQDIIEQPLAKRFEEFYRSLPQPQKCHYVHEHEVREAFKSRESLDVFLEKIYKYTKSISLIKLDANKYCVLLVNGETKTVKIVGYKPDFIGPGIDDVPLREEELTAEAIEAKIKS
jgi:hypothetical protein